MIKSWKKASGPSFLQGHNSWGRRSGNRTGEMLQSHGPSHHPVSTRRNIVHLHKSCIKNVLPEPGKYGIFCNLIMLAVVPDSFLDWRPISSPARDLQCGNISMLIRWLSIWMYINFCPMALPSTLSKLICPIFMFLYACLAHTRPDCLETGYKIL